MEQILEAFGIDWRLIVIQIFNFTILMGLLWYFLYTPILKILKERQEKIEKGVQDAKEAAASRAHADEEKNEIIATANKEAEDISLRAKQHAEEKRSEILMSAEEKAAAVLADAENRRERAREEGIRESEGEIAKIAVLAAEKLLRERS